MYPTSKKYLPLNSPTILWQRFLCLFFKNHWMMYSVVNRKLWITGNKFTSRGIRKMVEGKGWNSLPIGPVKKDMEKIAQDIVFLINSASSTKCKGGKECNCRNN